MKTDREMTESLLHRRDQYIKEKARKSVYLRLIPKIGVPLCAAVAVVSVLSVRGNIFNANAPGVDINLADGNPALTALSGGENAETTTYDIPWSIAETEKEKKGYSDEYSARELLTLTPEELKSRGILSPENIDAPTEIVCGNVIYKLSDAYITFEGLTDYQTDIMFIPFDETAVCTSSDNRLETHDVTVFNIGEIEWNAAILIDNQIFIYEKEKSAKFYIDGTVYQASALISDYNYLDYFNYEYSDGDYNVFSFTASPEETYWIVSDSSEDKSWLCRTAYPASYEKIILNTDYYGSVIDANSNIEEYVYALDNGKLDYNYYNISYTGESEEYECDFFMYNGGQYQFSGYPNNTDELYQWGELTLNDKKFTVFKVNRSTDTLAIIQQGHTAYFTNIYPAVQYSTSLQPLTREELETAVMIYTADPILALDMDYDRYCYYDGSYNVQFYYQNEYGSRFAFIVSSADDSLEESVTKLTLLNIETGESLNLLSQHEDIDEFLYREYVVRTENDWDSMQ